MLRFSKKPRSLSLRLAVAIAQMQRNRIRKFLRDDVFVLVIAGACTGAVSGVIAASMDSLSEAMHRILFALGPG
jgi:hypothetical protein